MLSVTRLGSGRFAAVLSLSGAGNLSLGTTKACMSFGSMEVGSLGPLFDLSQTRAMSPLYRPDLKRTQSPCINVRATGWTHVRSTDIHTGEYSHHHVLLFQENCPSQPQH